MPTIHPTAIIDPAAHLAEDVQVGPHCILEGDVRLGAGTRLIAHVHLKGPITLGQNNTVYPYACLGLEPQDRKVAPDADSAGVVIGDRNVLREAVTIHRATAPPAGHPTTVGHDNYLMVNAHLGHDVVLGNECTFANGAALGGHVHVGDRVTLGGNAVVQQFCRIGRLAMLSGAMGITRDLPPFCMAYHSRHVSSLNVIGLRRAGFRDSIEPLKRAFDLFFRSGHTNGIAADLIEAQLGDDPLCLELAAFIRSSTRGVCTYLAAPREAGVPVE